LGFEKKWRELNIIPMKIKTLFPIAFLLFSCGQPDKEIKNDSVAVSDSARLRGILATPEAVADTSTIRNKPLSDTTFIDGNHVTFLCPDDNRYAFLSHDPHAGFREKDSVFGDATTMAIDAIIHNKNFKGIRAIISYRRYIVIKDGKNCPITIDRDTINYGVILSGKNKELKFEKNVFPGEHYIQLVKDYFNLKK
jgi:hypothetical protein